VGLAADTFEGGSDASSHKAAASRSSRTLCEDLNIPPTLHAGEQRRLSTTTTVPAVRIEITYHVYRGPLDNNNQSWLSWRHRCRFKAKKGNLTAARPAGSRGIFRVASEVGSVFPPVRAYAATAASGRIPIPRITKITCAYNELAPLAKDQVLTLQLGKMLGDSGPRRTDQAGKVLVAEGDS
jgi:hypothetical protein